ncbi:helix-turn-helix domain-containing protein [Bacillus toyonensis]|uniref:helix-turn-helix domain-containing protein n=1 Tax=Bacillus toyonensis TaxID=155322 RepID=UPI001145A4F2|nr:winged helix-turn-helix domain-containing protein [Bacillus toyonensis]
MKQSMEYDQLEIRINELEKMMKKEKNRRLYERYQTIMLHLKGYTNIKIAEIIGRSNLTVGTYIKRYQVGGIAGLEISYSPGAPRRLAPEQEKRISEVVVHHTPAELGLKSEMNWTAPLLREWIYREWNIVYKDRAVLNILHRLGFSHTRPTYTLEKADEQKQQVFRETFETYKKTRKWGN